MSEKIKKKYLLAVFVILFITGIFASYQVGSPEHSIGSSYSKGEDIQGYVNMSFDNEPGTSIFKDSSGNLITLIDLLETDARHDYTCNPSECESSYSKTNPQTTKQITLNAGEETIIGFNLNSEIEEITNFSLAITSDVGEKCNNQLKIDLFDDGTNEVGNTQVNPEGFCAGRNYGCFDSEQAQEFLMTSNIYCQKVTLPEAPGFELGAWVKLISGSPDLKMNLYSIELNDIVKSCDLPPPSSGGERIYCDVEYLTTKQENYYVCLSTEGSGNYNMKGYVEDKCGFPASPYVASQEVASYEIYGRPKIFKAIGTLEIENQLQNGDFISFLTENYVGDTYDNLSCTGRNCIVPIKLISAFDQQLTISGELEYTDAYLGGTQTNIMYDIAETPTLINADYQKIYLDKGGFAVPNEIGPYDFTLKLNNNELFTEPVEVKKGVSILSINPVKTAVGLPTTFKLRLDSEENITGYEWNFGDGTNKTTFTNYATNTYDTIGSYSITATVEDNEGTKSSKTFNIIVGSASEVLDDMITEKEENLLKIKGQLLDYDLFSKIAIEDALDLDNVEEKLTKIRSNYTALGQGATEDQYGALLTQLIEIELPTYVTESSSSSPLSFYPKKQNIDLEIISSVTGDSYEPGLEYEDAIVAWNIENMQTKISVKEFSADYGFGEETLVKVFEANIKNLGQETPYLFAEESLVFGENKTSESGYYSKSLGSKETLDFYTTEDINFEDLPLFISPAISSLVVEGGISTQTKKKFKWGLFLIIMLILIILAIAVYFLLKRWYDKKYENYLFKDKNSLYNMVTFIQNAKAQGKDDNTITKDLRKSKWSNEQINYVMKKYAGKATGLPGFTKKAAPAPQSRPPRTPNQRRVVGKRY